MNILGLFVVVPVLMILFLFLCKDIKSIRAVMVTGATALLALTAVLVVTFLRERAANPDAEMLLVQSCTWYAPLNITMTLGVDGISVMMIALSSIIVFTGVFSSWNMDMAKEFFLWYCLLTIGVFGFFITIDLFSMFMFYEVALIPTRISVPTVALTISRRKRSALMVNTHISPLCSHLAIDTLQLLVRVSVCNLENDVKSVYSSILAAAVFIASKSGLR